MNVSAARYVIARLGGIRQTGKALGMAPTTVQGWKIRDKIPQEHFHAVIEALKARKVKFELDDFFRDHSLPETADAAA